MFFFSCTMLHLLMVTVYDNSVPEQTILVGYGHGYFHGTRLKLIHGWTFFICAVKVGPWTNLKNPWSWRWQMRAWAKLLSTTRTSRALLRWPTRTGLKGMRTGWEETPNGDLYQFKQDIMGRYHYIIISLYHYIIILEIVFKPRLIDDCDFCRRVYLTMFC